MDRSSSLQIYPDEMVILGDPVTMNMFNETSQELRMLSSVTLDCQVTKIVMNSGSQL